MFGKFAAEQALQRAEAAKNAADEKHALKMEAAHLKMKAADLEHRLGSETTRHLQLRGQLHMRGVIGMLQSSDISIE